MLRQGVADRAVILDLQARRSASNVAGTGIPGAGGSHRGCLGQIAISKADADPQGEYIAIA